MSVTDRMVKTGVLLSRIIVGATFLFSGFVKAVDPLGFTYKIEDYLIEMSLTALLPLALPVALLMVVVEFTLGMLLMLGIYRRVTTRLITLFMVCFTPLTLWIALANPVSDCGCFGDAFIISNWQTFFKNMVLLAGACLLMVHQKKLTPLFTSWRATVAALFTLLFILLFANYNLSRVPLFDFRPYHAGASIPAQMSVDPERGDQYETYFIYSREGKDSLFTEENYPWDDSTWLFVEMKTVLVKEGVKPAIEDFAVESLRYDAETESWHPGSDMTDIILSDSSYTFLMIAYALNTMSERHLDHFREIERYAEDNDLSFYLLTASPTDVIDQWERHHKTGFRFAHADERVLKTMIRSNPGLMLLKEGRVIRKWDDSNLPAIDRVVGTAEESARLKMQERKTTDLLQLLMILLLCLIPLLLLRRLECRLRTTPVER